MWVDNQRIRKVIAQGDSFAKILDLFAYLLLYDNHKEAFIRNYPKCFTKKFGTAKLRKTNPILNFSTKNFTLVFDLIPVLTQSDVTL